MPPPPWPAPAGRPAGPPTGFHPAPGGCQGSTSRTGAVAVSAVPVSRPDSKTRDRSGNAGNWSETPETARFPVPGLHREITSRREVKPWPQLARARRSMLCVHACRDWLPGWPGGRLSLHALHIPSTKTFCGWAPRFSISFFFLYHQNEYVLLLTCMF